MIGELFNVGSFSEVSNVKEASVVDSDLEKNIKLCFHILLTVSQDIHITNSSNVFGGPEIPASSNEVCCPT